LRIDQSRFERPDAVAQPGRQRQVVADAAQQRHRGVRVQVHEAGDEQVPGQRDALGRGIALPRLLLRQHVDDAVVLDDDGVVDEAGFGRRVGRGAHRRYPLRLDQRASGRFGGRHGRFPGGSEQGGTGPARLRRRQKAPIPHGKIVGFPPPAGHDASRLFFASPTHGLLRQRNASGQPRRGDASLLSRLRDERDRRPRASRRARRPEAGAPRVLFAMHEVNNVWNRPFVKCARIVGDVMGKYHPHGDASIYDTLVRMAQDFSLRYLLVDGQGNFGVVDGDNPAAMRYTECRLQRLAGEMLADIDRETVDFQPNYDGKENEPTVLPARIPNR